MLRKASLSYFIASIITIIVILIEVGIRSAVVSPFVLLDSNKDNNPKVLISHSLYQGDFLLTYQEGHSKDRSEAAFQLGESKYISRRFHLGMELAQLKLTN